VSLEAQVLVRTIPTCHLLPTAELKTNSVEVNPSLQILVETPQEWWLATNVFFHPRGILVVGKLFVLERALQLQTLVTLSVQPHSQPIAQPVLLFLKDKTFSLLAK